ncbi:multicomponent Na+:H+ antiporter subunit G [Rhizobium sp. RU35A]|uniref:Monovalent cation/H(+) antiporter subunit G n=1 Tax=Rhizobium straminoryzae TaxID=1387186 RepID=A0A549T304_9HYPH|nr:MULTISPECIES: monovalent cation/H(+) antiporter subunit G [Rhizobium]TRL36253.1 monovalent cation/H(+) antiporter subunit G [Rhizobium straminoryzae]SIP94892.1 multicomponent Na+:H+ antiporter subunit G [Rhizobium sp. RU35A]
MSLILTLVTVLLLVAGSAFALMGSIGLIRFPDMFSRMHAASKAGTVGSGLLLLAAGLHSADLSIFARALAGFFFFILTTPVSAHLLARAAHKAGYRLHPSSVADHLRQDSP